jgi:hypothetical protein
MVDTIVRPPQTSEAPTIAPRRRWPRVLTLVVVGIVVTLLTLGSIWIANYAPLVQGSLELSTDRTDVKIVRVDAFDMRGTVFTVPTGRTATFRYRLSISNSGPVAVRIDSIGTSAGSVGAGSLTRRAVEVIPDPWRSSGPIGFTSEEPWHPFTLAPGREAVVVMEAEYHGRCMQRGDSVSWFREPVTYSIFGVSRHADLQAGVEVRFTGDGSCGTA